MINRFIKTKFASKIILAAKLRTLILDEFELIQNYDNSMLVLVIKVIGK